MRNNMLAIGIAVLERHAIGATFEERFKAAAPVAHTDELWWGPSDDERMRCCVGAALKGATDDEERKVTCTLNALQALSAAMSGVPVDFGTALPENADDVLPLLVWFEEAKP